MLFRPGLGYYCAGGEAPKAAVFLRSDFQREFESTFLQRRVTCELVLAATRAEDPDRRLFASAGREMTERQDRRLKARLRFARLRHQAIIEDVDYRAPRGPDRTLFQKVAQGDWIDVRRSFCPYR